jgi:hypothetical protein
VITVVVADVDMLWQLAFMVPAGYHDPQTLHKVVVSQEGLSLYAGGGLVSISRHQEAAAAGPWIESRMPSWILDGRRMLPQHLRPGPTHQGLAAVLPWVCAKLKG